MGSSTSGNRRIQINFRSSLPIFLNRIYLPHVIHTAYLHDKPLHFVEVYNAGGTDFQPGYLITSEQEMTLEQAIRELSKEKSPNGILYLCEHPDTVWLQFCHMFTLVEASGGVVENADGELLAIFRKGKWDLPKGKVDGGESPEEAGIREVEEECGITSPVIESELRPTFHTYEEKGRRLLKKTHWYRMRYDGNEALLPQLEESITDARWMSRDEFSRVFLGNTYASLRAMLERYLKSEKA